MIIKLNGIRLYGHHGATPLDQKVGAWYETDIAIRVKVEDAALLHDNLDGTINYADVLDSVLQQFNIPSCLLEHLAHRIAQAILQQFSKAQEVTVVLRKLNPPMPYNIRSAAVELTVKRQV